MATVAMEPSNELFTPCSYYIMRWEDAGKGGEDERKKSPKETREEDEEFDLFGKDAEESSAAAATAKKLAEEMKKKKAAESKGKGKKEVVNRSMLVIEVKPAAADTNLDEVLRLVKNIKLDGLTWGEGFKKVPVAFGLYKLQVQCVIVDDLVNTNELTDMIEELGLTEEQKKKRDRREQEEAAGDDGEEEEEEDEEGGLVQSAEIVSFNKL